MLGRIGANVERTIVAVAGYGSVCAIRLPEHESIDLPALQSRKCRRPAGSKTNGFDFRKIGSAQLGAGLEKQFGIAVRPCTQRQAFEILPCFRVDALGEGQALAAVEHPGDCPEVAEVLFFHQAHIDVAHDRNVDLVCHQRQLQIGVAAHWHNFQIDIIFLCIVPKDHHIGLMNLNGISKPDLFGSLNLRGKSQRG